MRHSLSSREKVPEKDQRASYLRREIMKHGVIYNAAMPDILDFFDKMVPLAYEHPDRGSDDQRKRIRELLESVLKGIPITTSEIEQVWEKIYDSAEGDTLSSNEDGRFWRLCYIWLDEFIAKVEGRQSVRLSNKVLSFWTPDACHKKEIAPRNADEDNKHDEKTALARLWKFTHGSYE